MKKFLSLVLALVMTMSLVTISAGAKDFTDNSKIAYKEAVDVVSALKIVDGYEDGAFNPTNTLTRGAAAKIICNLILGPTTASALSADTAPYKDVPTTNNFAGYIAYCAQQGIISGYADGTFRPAGTLTGYAFMKMLLGALGYDAETEGYVGANWSVQVGKQALGIGLDDGNDDFVGTKAVTREEACLYAFNTLKATMVEYENQSQIVIGDITVNTSSKAKDMANTSKTDGYIDNNSKMEFAEKYFTDLRLKSGNDSFSRPANVWSLKSVEIGTYAKTPDASYTAKVENGDVYKDLGLGSTMDKADVTVYVNGEEKEDLSIALRKSGDTKVGESANGVLTEVFYDKDDGSAIVTQVKTYVGEISKTVKATDKKDAYVEVITSVNSSVPPSGAAGTEKFETTEEFEDEAYVLYTFSIPDDEIKSVVLAEEVTGTVTKVVNKPNDSDNSKVTVDGTEYKASATMAANLLKNISVDMDYTAYLDAYGYVITVDEEDYKDYALVLEIESSDDAGFKSDRAKLLLSDGTVRVVTLDKDYKNKGIAVGEIVTYKAKDNNDYVLKEVKLTQSTQQDIADPPDMGSSTFNLKNEIASITTGGKTVGGVSSKNVVYGNSKTMFVVKNVTDKDYSAYTGVKSVPSVKAQDLSIGAAGIDDPAEKVTAYWYCKNGDIATVMFIIPGSDDLTTNESNSLLFLAKESVSDLIHDSDGDYYEYQAVVNGEVKTVKVDWKVKVDGVAQSTVNSGKLNGLYSKYNVSDDIITGVTTYSTAPAPTGKFAGMGVGTDRNSADYTVQIVSGTNAGIWTVDDGAKFYEIDKKGNVSIGAYSSVVKDDDDRAYFVIEDGTVIYMFVEEVDTKNDAQPASSVTVTAEPSTSLTVGDTLTLAVTDVTLADSKHDTITGYQWYKDGTADANKIAGATGKTYKIPAVAAGDAGAYYCAVTTYNDKVDGKDTAVKFSAATNVTVSAAPAATMNVTINRYNVNGNTLLGSETVKLTAADVASIAAPAVTNYTVAGAATTSVTFVENGNATVSFYYKADLVSIAVKKAPTKTAYVPGTAFAPAGLEITATYADGTTQDVAYAAHGSDFSFDVTTVDVAGDVTITYAGKTCTQAVTLASITKIEVKTAPAKTAYSSSDSTFDATGLVITVTYDNSDTVDVAYAGNEGDFSFSPETITKGGNVTITYANENCTQAVTYT